MAIGLPSGFRITVQEPVDNRLVLTKAEMIAVVDASMPTKYLCVCKDDGKLYVYDSSNTASAETGKFRLYASGGTTYTAGDNIQINGNVISATDTKYTAGSNVQINGTVISATDTVYNDTEVRGLISQETTARQTADTALQNSINLKQDKLTAGANITIDSNNVISATGGGASYSAGNGINIADNTISTKLGNGLKYTDSNSITIQPADRSINVGEFGARVPIITTSLEITDNGIQVKMADNSIVAYNSGTGTKGIKVNTDVIQPKLTAGTNISIDNNNVISSTIDLSNYATLADLQIGKELTAGTTVGGITAGTVYPATTKMAKIIEDLLGGSGPGPVTGITVYYGASTTAPTSITGLTSRNIPSASVIGEQNQNIVCDDEDNGEYPIFAVPVGYKVSKWVAASFPSMPLSTVKVVADNYNIYYVDSLVYDAPDGTDYIITIAQEG